MANRHRLTLVGGAGIANSGEGDKGCAEFAQIFSVIVAFCKASVSALAVDGAALTIVGDTGGRLFVYSTDPLSFDLDELEFSLGEGPCIDAVATQAPVFTDALAAAAARGRWPGFAGAAAALGAGAEYTFPLVNAGVSFAVLATYRREPGPLRPAQIKATEALVASFEVRVLRELVEHLSGVGGVPPGVRDRAEVHQATGMVSVQLGLAVEDALARLRADAFANGVSLVMLAHDVVDRKRRFHRDG